MTDTVVHDLPAQRARLAARPSARRQAARSPPSTVELPQEPEFFMGGGGLYGTAGDYLASRG